jgi:hypothetical protein
VKVRQTVVEETVEHEKKRLTEKVKSSIRDQRYETFWGVTKQQSDLKIWKKIRPNFGKSSQNSCQTKNATKHLQ